MSSQARANNTRGAEAAVQAEFEQLYALLHIDPDCTLEEFQRAYRRAIAELHPDRWQGEAGGADQQSHLQELISLHSLATRFYRRHGRLPGARASQLASPTPLLRKPAPGDDRSMPRRRASTRRWLVVIGLLAFLAWQLPRPAPEQAATGTEAGSEESATAERHLALGMDERAVLAIQGEPEHRGANEWHYGSSWLRFEDERLVDWYSSPFHRLNTATSTPPRQ